MSFYFYLFFYGTIAYNTKIYSILLFYLTIKADCHMATWKINNHFFILITN